MSVETAVDTAAPRSAREQLFIVIFYCRSSTSASTVYDAGSSAESQTLPFDSSFHQSIELTGNKTAYDEEDFPNFPNPISLEELFQNFEE